MRQYPIASKFHDQQPIHGIPGSFLWILFTILAGVIVLPFVKIQSIAKPQPPPAPRIETQIETSITTVGEDSHHRRLPFTVYVLAQDLSWKLESTGALEGGKTIVSPDLIAAMIQARDVFCVGTASNEGESQAEEVRAAQRALTLAQWLRSAMGDSHRPNLFTLNAGQYQGPRELPSALQRKAIILISGPHDDDVELGEGLKSGLEQQQQTSPLVLSLLHDYSRSKRWLKISNNSALTNPSSQMERATPPLALAHPR